MIPRFILLVFLSFTRLLVAESPFEQSPPSGKEPHVFSVLEENDLLYDPAPDAHQDRHYTQGLKVIYSHPWQNAPLIECLPHIGIGLATSNTAAWSFGQSISTPEDDGATNVISGDRPYAGWLYVGLALQRRGTTAGGTPVLESFGLDVGVIGPEALGEEAQNSVHRWRNLRQFQGWDNQLETEPAFVFKYGRAWQPGLGVDRRYLQLIPNIGAQLGTVRVSGNAGVTVRAGYNLPDDFGVQTIDSSLVQSSGPARGQFSIYAFAQVEGNVVGRNIFLDGNTFCSSHSVEKKTFTGDYIWGIGCTPCRHLEVSLTFDTRTLEFTGQQGNDQFGSLCIRGKWAF